jgi:hypothetical protein
VAASIIFTGLYLVLIMVWWSDGLGRLVLPVWRILLAGIPGGEAPAAGFQSRAGFLFRTAA